MRRIVVFPFAGMLFLAVLFALMLAANLYTYYRLSEESPIAELQFLRIDEGHYEALIAYGDFCTLERLTLYGDQWRLDARRPWVNLLGLDSRYSIERLGGRCRDINRENSSRHGSHALHPPDGAGLVALLARHSGRFSPVDTFYGSSVYKNINPRYVYRVLRSQSGLLVRKAEPPSARRGGGMTTIEINRSCAESPDPIGRVRRFLERLVGKTGE